MSRETVNGLLRVTPPNWSVVVIVNVSRLPEP